MYVSDRCSRYSTVAGKMTKTTFMICYINIVLTLGEYNKFSRVN